MDKQKQDAPITYDNANAVFSFIINILGFILMIAGFASPYWLQSYSRIHTPFRRLGLWEFCLDGYVHRTDINMISYYGCWWIYSPEFDKIRHFLAPWWFIIVQVLMSISLALYALSLILMCIYVLCGFSNTRKRRVVSTVIVFINGLIACLVTVSLIVFGVNQRDTKWMPYPFQNFPSSGYAFTALSGFLACVITGYMIVQMYIDTEVEEEDAYNFPLVSQTMKSSSQMVK